MKKEWKNMLLQCVLFFVLYSTLIKYFEPQKTVRSVAIDGTITSILFTISNHYMLKLLKNAAVKFKGWLDKDTERIQH